MTQERVCIVYVLGRLRNLYAKVEESQGGGRMHASIKETVERRIGVLYCSVRMSFGSDDFW